MKSLLVSLAVASLVFSCVTGEPKEYETSAIFPVYLIKDEESPQAKLLFDRMDIPHEFSTRAGVFSFKASVIDKSIQATTELELQGIETKKIMSFDEVLGVYEVRAKNPIALSPRPRRDETLSLTFGLAELLSKRSWYGMSPSMYALDRALKKVHAKSGRIWIISESFNTSGFFNFTVGVSAN